MCLILVAWRVHPRYPLLLAANRDEFFARGTQPAHWWPAPERILAGRDLQSGGTWLGITRSGRAAALTNFRKPAQQRSNAPSRGELVADWLRTDRSIETQLARLHARCGAYNGFNLLFGDGERLAVFESEVGSGRVLEPGIYGLSNQLLDTPWPKVLNAKSALPQALTQLPDESALLALLRDERGAEDALLPRTGLSLEWERLLSSAFIRAPGYGTRCSTVLRIDRQRQVSFREWSWNPAGELDGLVQQQFELDSAAEAL